MTVSFPTSLDDFTNPSGTDRLDNADAGLKHATQHANANDAIEAIEAEVGITDSTVATSVNYKLKNGGLVRKTATVTTDSLAADAQTLVPVLPLGKACTVIKIATDYPAWVRFYSTSTHQSDDQSRLISVDAEGEHGMLLEVLTSASNLSLDMAPAAQCYSLESSPSANINVTVTNKDTVDRAITVTVTYLVFEG